MFSLITCTCIIFKEKILKFEQILRRCPSKEIFSRSFLRGLNRERRSAYQNRKTHYLSWRVDRYALVLHPYTVELQWLRHWFLVYHGCF